MLAIVTGASSGLGKALCHALHARGYALIGVARHFEDPPPGKLLTLDLTSATDRRILTTLIEKTPPDLLINNAGIGFYGQGINLSIQEQKETLCLNTEVVLELTLTTAKALAAAHKKGTILNVSSSAALFPFPSFAIYAASKECVRHFSCALDFELTPLGIRVLTSLPGQIATPFRYKAAKNKRASYPKFWTLSPERAATLILKQIARGKQTQVIDWRYKIASFIARLLPQKLLMKLLNRSISTRIS